MKTILVFKQNGEIEEKELNFNVFDINKFENFNSYKKYNTFIILYNNFNKEKNLTIFPFTEDRYNGEVNLLLYTDEDKIKNLKLQDYIKILNKIKHEKNDMYYSSEDEDLFGF